MGSWLIIIVLIVLLLISIGKIILFHWDIKRMTSQLEEIIEDVGTNELVRTNTHSKILMEFISKINQLIQIFKQEQQNMLRREYQLKQEITNISHDLRTPLTSIKGFSELLTDTSLSDAEKQEYLSIIQRKIDNLMMIADEFYELSQVESADVPLEMEQLFLDTIVAETMLLFYEEFEKRELHVQIDEVTVPPILADRKATSRIVTNIVQNALRYAKSYLTIHFIEGEEYIHLRAVNDVNHRERINIDRIFDRTFRLDASRTGGQLGLGLHIVKQLVQQQGGKVDADLHNHEFMINVTFKKWTNLK